LRRRKERGIDDRNALHCGSEKANVLAIHGGGVVDELLRDMSAIDRSIGRKRPVDVSGYLFFDQLINYDDILL
jgi:hypothetical protein